MKLNRRSFIKLIPVAVVAVWSWWFLRPTAKESVATLQVSGSNSVESQVTSVASIGSQITSMESTTSQTASTPEGFQFPATWNGESPPSIDSATYRLRIDGDVSNPLELSLTELYAMTGVHRTLRIQCVEGWSADVPWEGIPLLYLLKRTGALLSNVGHVVVQDVAGYSVTLSSDEVANLDCMIALKVDGFPLTIDHGYPARLVAPSRLGLDWVKCVGRVTCRNK